MQLATQTLSLIEKHVAEDQGAKFRQLQGEAFKELTDAFDPVYNPYRSHLGASVIGNECFRQLWYGFRWAEVTTFSGRMVRLFNRGHLEEARFVALLRLCNFKVWSHTPQGKQIGVNYGHFAGSCDAIVQGCPDIPMGEHCLVEFKTHGEKSFQKLTAEGVALSKYTHYVQMQIYMNGLGLRWALYLAVNKNTDEIHAEIIPLDYQIIEYHFKKAEYIITSSIPPRKINESASWYVCKMCSMKHICHYNQPAELNCRTCTMSQPLQDGSWLCKHTGEILTKEMQIEGCSDYRRLI